MLTQTAFAQEWPDEVGTILDEYHKGLTAVQAKADAGTTALQHKLVSKLKKLQDKYCRAGKLDEAIAARDAIWQMSGIQPDPGYVKVTPDDVGKSFLFSVTGSVTGEVWGSETYTSDSRLAAAAVHAGILRPGARGVVRVRVVPGQEHYNGSVAHGVTSKSYGAWEVSFTVEAAPEPRDVP